jgi:TRAP-type C4-dicarboxylate transport system permease small subunit
MEKALQYYQTVTGLFARGILGLAAAMVAFDVLSMCAEAVARYVFGSSRAFMEEVPRFLLPCIVFPMMGVLLRMRKHIGVDLLPDKLKGKRRSMLMILVYGVILGISLQFTLAGIAAVAHFRATGLESVTEIVFPMWWIYLFFPLGFGVLGLFAIEMLLVEGVHLRGLIRAGGRHGASGGGP